MGIVAQCVPLDVGTTYRFGGKVYIPGGNTASADVFYVLIPFPQADCQGPPPPAGGIVQTPDVTTVGAWELSKTTFTNGFALSARISAAIAPRTAGRFQANFDDVEVTAGALPCFHGFVGELCLLNQRFAVDVSFSAGAGQWQFAQPVGISDSSGYYWFFDAGNVEVLVKLVDGCAVNGHFWFFAAGLTNLGTTFVVMDTQTGARKYYETPANTAFAPIQDVAALACP